MTWSNLAIVTVPAAALHKLPDYASPMETQVLMGYPVEVLGSERDGRWKHVRTIDGMVAYVYHNNIAEPTDKWCTAPKSIVTKTRGNMLAGSIVATNDDTALKDVARPLAKWFNLLSYNLQSLLDTALSMQGIPYLWGGTTTNAVDCSGLVYVAGLLNGVVMKRNASEQPVGSLMPHPNRKGDLVFFGQDKITHVGIYLGNEEYLHSQGYVQISSINPTSTACLPHNNPLGATPIADIHGVLQVPHLCDMLPTKIYCP